MDGDGVRVLLAAAIVHLLASGLHGWAHATIPVEILDWQLGFAAVVLLAAPIVAVGLLAFGRDRTAAWLLLGSGLAGLVFEGLAHFVIANPDHVSTVGSGWTLFASTAALSTVADAAVTVVAAWYLTVRSR